MGKFLDSPTYGGKFLDEVAFNEEPKKSISDFALNKLPSSAVNAAANIVSPIIHPIRTAKGIGNIAAGGVEKYSPAIMALKAMRAVPEELPQEKYFNEAANTYKQRYGGGKNIAETAYNDPVGMGLDALMVAEPFTGAIRKAAPTIAGKTLEGTGTALQESGGRFNNFLIKPRAAGYKFGANPGRSVAKYIGPQVDKEGLLDAISNKKNELLTQLEINVKKHPGSLVDASPVFQNIIDSIDQMRSLPRTYLSQIASHHDLFNDVAAMIKSKAIIKNGKIYVNPADAIAIKRQLGDIPSWNVLDPKLGGLTKTVRKAYGAFDKEIDKAVPGSAALNQDISDLIGAQKGIQLGKQRDLGKSPISLIDLGFGGLTGMHSGGLGTAAGVAGSMFLRSTPFNTTAGYLSYKLGKLLKGAGKKVQGVGNSAKTSLGPKAVLKL